MKHADSKRPTPAFPVNRKGLIAWLTIQPPEQVYNWRDGATCVFAQFIKAAKPDDWWFIAHSDVAGGICEYLYIGSGLDPKFWTFGAALRRAIEIESGSSALAKIPRIKKRKANKCRIVTASRIAAQPRRLRLNAQG